VHQHGFGNATGAGFADEVIGELHVARDLGRETLDEDGGAARQPLEARTQLLVVAANEDELPVGQAAGDIEHRRRALAAEQHRPTGNAGSKPSVRRAAARAGASSGGIS